MSKEAEQNNEKDDNFINDMFQFDEDKFEEEEEESGSDLDDYDGISFDDKDDENKDEDKDKDEDLDKDEDKDEDKDGINFEDKDKDEDEKIDLEAFNKKLNTDFKTEEELKSFFAKKELNDGKEADDALLEKSERELAFYGDLVDPEKTSDEALMRKQYESIAIQDKKDLNDQDVKDEIDYQLQEIIDNNTLSLHARSLRTEIKTGMIAPAQEARDKIVTKRDELEKATQKTNKEQLQNAFVDIFKAESFYGIDVDKKEIADVYKDVNSGEFLESLKTDKNTLAELAMMHKYKQQIYKKASGLSYGDGMKAILDEFKSKKESRSISHAQQRGTAGGSDKQKGLINDFTYERPIEEVK